MGNLPSGTVSFLFTDIEGSTQLLHLLGDEYGVLLADHRRLFRSVVAARGGVEVDTQGDAFLCAFTSAGDAVGAAADAQRAFAAHPWPGGAALRVRMGVHTGAPTLTDDGYVGIDLHKGARVMACGHGGQVLLSHAARTALGESAAVLPLGEHRLKDLTSPEPLFQLVIDGLPETFPPLRALFNVNLPVQSTPLIGREDELAEITAVIDGGCRLLTLTGPGGTGKTRLALQAGAELAEAFPAGVHFVPLAALTDPQLVASAISQVLGVREAPGQSSADTLTEHLRGRQLLLIVDNLEHLLPAVPLLGRLLADCAGLRVLATSREPLHLHGEQEYPVPPLTQNEALALFAERARQVKRTFRLEDDRPALEEICRRLDRLPLAIELAAARIRLLPPAQLLQRLQQRLPLLTGGAADGPDRQRTLRATIEWSHDLLTPTEQELFARLSVFAGGSTLHAAETVCDADLDTLTSLVEKSLISQTDTTTGEPRFTMLETIREYAAEQHAELGDAAATARGAHAAHYHHYFTRQGLGLPWPPRNAREAAEWNEELQNARAALAHLYDQGEGEMAAQLTLALCWLWYGAGAFEEAGHHLSLGWSAATSPRCKIITLGQMSILAGRAGERKRRVALLEQILEELPASPDPATEAQVCNGLAQIAHEGNDAAGAMLWAARATESAAQSADEELQSLVRQLQMYHLAREHLLAGQIGKGKRVADEIKAAAAECVTTARRYDNEVLETWVGVTVSDVAASSDDSALWSLGATYGRRAAELAQGLSDQEGRAMALANAATCELLLGRNGRAAAQSLRAALEWFKTSGEVPAAVETMLCLAAALVGWDNRAAYGMSQAALRLSDEYDLPVRTSRTLVLQLLSGVGRRLTVSARVETEVQWRSLSLDEAAAAAIDHHSGLTSDGSRV